MERLGTILRDLGLDDGMIQVYEFMADHPKVDFGQLYDGTTLSRRGLSIAVEALIAMGAVKRDGPHYVIGDLRESLSAMAPARIEEIRAKINSYRHVPKPAPSCPMVELVKADIADIPSFWGRDIESSINDIAAISHTLAWLDDETLDLIKTAIERGVRVRVLTYEHPDLASDARALREVGAEVRCGKYARLVQFIVVDGISMSYDLPVPPRGQHYFGLRIRDRETCGRTLEEIFEPAWNDAESL